MSKCTQCFNELTSGDSHYEFGLCNKCYKEIMDNMINTRPVPIDMNEEKDQQIAELENQSQNDSYTINELVKANKKFVGKIKYLESEIKWYEDILKRTNRDNKLLMKMNLELENKFTVSEKALELACEDYINSEQELVENCIIEGGVLNEVGFQEEKKFYINYFMKQAEKELLGDKE